MAKSICIRCFHSYVCEQFNEHRDGQNEKCHFFHDHFVPSADVVEVRHGEWTPMHSKAPWLYRCSLCKIIGDDGWCYCPNCGAKMDGKEQE